MNLLEEVKKKREGSSSEKSSRFLLDKVKQKREFSKLPDSIVRKALEKSSGDVKDARALLRKYFGVFLTNKVLRGKLSGEEILKAHISSKKRDYGDFYGRIFEGVEDIKSIIDLGAGVNGFSYNSLQEVVGEVDYLAVEASGQLVSQINDYFEKEGLKGSAVCEDLSDIEGVLKILKEQKKPRVVFMFQIIDALENLEKDFSKDFILEVSKGCEKIVLTLPLVSLGGRKKFEVSRKWLADFLEKNFLIEKDFEMFGERVICFRK